MTDIPTIVTKSGLQPIPPAVLRAQLVAMVAATNPDYTANLPGSLIEDIASTDTGALVLCNSMMVELVNSLTPYAANEFLLNQLGQLYGVQRGLGSNAGVTVVFVGSPGFVIKTGFTVSDGGYQYVVQDGGAIGGDSHSLPLTCVATTSGTWPIPANTVNQLVTSVPAGVALSVNNPDPGTPGTGPQTSVDYRAQVLQAGFANAQGLSSFLRTKVLRVPGTQSRLISVIQNINHNWEILIGGSGDPYYVAGAVYESLFDFFNVAGSVLAVTGITQANPGVVSTDLNHGLTTGSIITLAGVVGMTAVNATPLTVTVVSSKTFSIGVDTSGYDAYVSGGVVSPNPRNVTVTLSDYPDNYTITYVNPPQQTVNIALTWNTISTNAVSPAAVQQLGSAALVDYVNSITVGQLMNLFELQAAFQLAVSSILPIALLTRMVFVVLIDGVLVEPEAGTGIIAGDPESFFFASGTTITITQG